MKLNEINENEISSTNCVILFGGETLNDYFLDELIKFNENYKKNKPKTVNTQHNTQCIFKAIGVSSNQEYTSKLVNKLQLFETIVFRSIKDYKFFKEENKMESCYYAPDIILALNLATSVKSAFKKYLPLKITKKYVGFFLSQTAVTNMNLEDKKIYITTVTNYVKYWLDKNYRVKLFSMCTNNIESENDNIINEIVFNEISKKLNRNELTNIKYYKSNRDILNRFPKLSFSVCWRYHSHILSIVYNIPFISISDTPKVITLLEENDLSIYKATSSTYEEKVNYLIKKESYIKQNIKNIYTKNNKLTHIYLNPKLYVSNKPKKTFYINKKEIQNILYKTLENYTSYRSYLKTPLDKANFILFSLTKNFENEYIYGLENKISNGIDNKLEIFKNDIEWLINEFILKHNLFFYEISRNILNLPQITNPNGFVNISYISQNNYKGVHRSGWNYVYDNLNKYNDTNNKILCDLYLDRTFHWKCNDYVNLRVIPYNKPWTGFIHHTIDDSYSENNTTSLFKNRYFINSLNSCKCLFVLSQDLKEKVEILIKNIQGSNPNIRINNLSNIPVYTLTHPTEFVEPEKEFTMSKFLSNTTRHIIQIGAWMRNINAINTLTLGENPLNLTKTVLKGKKMESYYNEGLICARDFSNPVSSSLVEGLIRARDFSNPVSSSLDTEINFSQSEDIVMCRDKKTKGVTLNEDIKVLTYLENNDYDLLLMKNIVFINLIGASAVNTLIECIVRNTPIFVNRLPAVEEALGSDYPLLYDNISDVTNMLNVDKIKEGYKYLSKLNKDKFKIETFIREFENKLKYTKL